MKQDAVCSFPPRGLLLLSLLALLSKAEEETACDYSSDDCQYQADGECDVDLGFCPEGTDCYDCDPCSQYKADCDGCVEAGCFWCPGDANCFSAPVGQDFWDTLFLPKVTFCPDANDWVETCDPVGEDNFFSGPLYDSMAYSYEMINVAKVWAMGYTGAGVHVRVNDAGVDAEHPEFAGRFDVEHSCPSYLPLNISNEEDWHGTTCASIIGASGSNGECAVGVSPGVTLSSCVVIGSDIGPEEALQAFNESWEIVDISSNSWGVPPCSTLNNETRRLLAECPFSGGLIPTPCDTCATFFDDPSTCFDAILAYCSNNLEFENDPIACTEFLDLYVYCDYTGGSLSSEEQAQFYASAVTDGRNGLGTIFVFAAGNSYTEGHDTSAAGGHASLRFTIAVGSVGHDRLHASYSTPGESVFITAPGGDTKDKVSNFLVARPGGGCWDAGDGTSYAAPVVSGVIALMLEANPGLGWRDVQAILAKTAQKTDPENGAWSQTNRYGLSHSSLYGFGIVDAYAAVNMSLGWTNIGPEEMITFDSGVIDILIYNDESVSSHWTFTVDGYGPEFVVEYVSVLLDLRHLSRGDLTIQLESPTGTVSILAPGDRPEYGILPISEFWQLMTVKHYGEAIDGNWTVRIVDEEEENNFAGCYDDESFQIEVFDPETSEYLFTDIVNCTFFEEYGICANETIVTTDSYDVGDVLDDVAPDAKVRAGEACCACGGGIRVDDDANPDMLKQVRAYFYGRYDDEGVAAAGGSGVNGTIEDEGGDADDGGDDGGEDGADDGGDDGGEDGADDGGDGDGGGDGGGGNGGASTPTDSAKSAKKRRNQEVRRRQP